MGGEIPPRRNMKDKKVIKVEVVAEIEVDAEFYEGMSNDEIATLEMENWQEWILENVISDKITVTDKKSEKK